MSTSRDRLHEIVADFTDDAFGVDLRDNGEVYDAVTALYLLLERVAEQGDEDAAPVVRIRAAELRNGMTVIDGQGTSFMVTAIERIGDSLTFVPMVHGRTTFPITVSSGHTYVFSSESPAADPLDRAVIGRKILAETGSWPEAYGLPADATHREVGEQAIYWGDADRETGDLN